MTRGLETQFVSSPLTQAQKHTCTQLHMWLLTDVMKSKHKQHKHPKTKSRPPSDLWPASPDKVQQGVGRGHDGPRTQPLTLHLRPHTGFDGDDEHDADHYCDEGGPQVVGDGEDAHPTTRLRLHWRQTRH